MKMIIGALLFFASLSGIFAFSGGGFWPPFLAMIIIGLGALGLVMFCDFMFGPE